MKKILFAFSFVLSVVLVSSFNAAAGSPFEGVITYKITYPDNKLSESQMAMYPKVATASIKGSKSRTDLQMSGMTTVYITDYMAKTKVALINMMGQKYAIKQTAAEIEKELEKEVIPTIQLTSETKLIAGYTCKKAVITVADGQSKGIYEVYYTNELGSKMVNFDNPLYKEIDGTLMEFSMKAQMGSMKFTATSVEKKNLSAKDFEVPSDYTLTTLEELKSKFGGGTE